MPTPQRVFDVRNAVDKQRVVSHCTDVIAKGVQGDTIVRDAACFLQVAGMLVGCPRFGI